METMICTSKIVSQRNGTESYPILLDSSLTTFNRIIQNTRNFEMYRAFPFSVYRFTDISPPPPPLSVFHFNDDHPHCARGKSLSNGNSSTVFPFSPPLVRSNGREHFSISASRFSIDDETKKGRKERKLRGRKLSSHPPGRLFVSQPLFSILIPPNLSLQGGIKQVFRIDIEFLL